MKKPISVAIVQFLLLSVVNAQSPQAAPSAAKSLQESQPPAATSAASEAVFRQVRLPAGTQIDVETTYTVSSLDLTPGDLMSFRVLIPVKVDDVTVIDQYALVTGRVVKAKRGGHWGKAGKLTWVMQDVVAVDLARVPLTLQPDAVGERGVTGTSHGGEVATKTAVLGALMIPVFPIAPLALMSGFRRGENAVLVGGRRFVVYVASNTMIKVRNERADR
jgi:hypothetical protein